MIKYIIIDDEYIAHDVIKDYCNLLPNMQFLQSCYDAIEALTFLKKEKVDLIFLDLNMPKLKGFDFLKTLVAPPNIIVTTAYQEYALESYELNVIDYLLKPFSFERFLKAIQKIDQADANAQILTNKLEEKESVEQLFFYTNKKYIQVRIKDILFAEAAGNYVKIITSKETLVVREKISDLYQKLSPYHFLQVHKSFIVAKNQIDFIEGNHINIQNHIIPIGKIYKAEVMSFLSYTNP